MDTHWASQSLAPAQPLFSGHQWMTIYSSIEFSEHCLFSHPPVSLEDILLTASLSSVAGAGDRKDSETKKISSERKGEISGLTGFLIFMLC